MRDLWGIVAMDFERIAKRAESIVESANKGFSDA